MNFHPTRAPAGRAVSVGVVLPPRLPAQRFLELAAVAEDHGADSVWVFDHLQPFTASGSWLECWTALTLAAARTSRVRVGPQVLCQSFRSPTLLAKMATTLDTAIGGRLEVAVGAGWHEPEYRAFGFDFPDARTRFAQTVEYMEILRPGLAGEVTTFAGAHYRAEAMQCAPASPQAGGPPLTLGAAGQDMLRLGARLADNLNLPSTAVRGDVGKWAARVASACEQAGRDRATLGLTLQVPVAIGKSRAAAKAAIDADPGAAAVGHPETTGIFGSVEECRDTLGQWAALGVDEVQCVMPVTEGVGESVGLLVDAACA